MWADLVAWFQSPGGARVLQTAIIPAVAIIVAGVIAALIGRRAVASAIARADRAEAVAAVAGLVEAARAATDPDSDRGQRRRAVRLRTEADVRTRLLPMAGANLAADWASDRTDALRALGAEAPTSELDELRDRLVAWTKAPGRAKRIFTAPLGTAATTPAAAPAEEAATVAEDTAPEPGVRRTPHGEVPQEVLNTAPTSTTPVPEPIATAVALGSSVPETASVPVPDGGAVPAWQRTRAMERLQQERAARSQPVEPARDAEAEATTDGGVDKKESVDTAPVQLQKAHRAAGAPAADADEAVRLEAHQVARHSRPTDAPAPAVAAVVGVGVAPTVEPTPVPAWLDTYDDEAQVTQNLDLKTPPPVAAASVRDRGAAGDDLVPRS